MNCLTQKSDWRIINLVFSTHIWIPSWGVNKTFTPLVLVINKVANS